MKNLWVLLCIVAAAGCAKTNEDLAKDLINERLKTTLPNFDTYEPVSYGNIGKAFLSFEETDQYLAHTKAIKAFKDSTSILEQQLTMVKTNASGDSLAIYQAKNQQLADSLKQRIILLNDGKSAYQPQQLYKLMHTYKVKDNSGKEVLSGEAFYFDKDFTKIIKVAKIS